MSKLERAFQFVTINNKSHKVPTDNLKALIANFDAIEAPLRARLTQASVTVPRFATYIDVLNEDPESPFYKMVNWVNNRFEGVEPVVQPTALENSLRAITRAFPETKEDESDALAVLFAMWTSIFAAYGITIENAAQFPNLMLKTTIQALSEMIVQKLKADFDIAFNDHPFMGDNGDAAGAAARGLMFGVPILFWQDVWVLKSLDTSAGRAIIQDDLRRLKRLVQGNGGVLPDDWKERLSLYRAGEDREDRSGGALRRAADRPASSANLGMAPLLNGGYKLFASNVSYRKLKQICFYCSMNWEISTPDHNMNSRR